MRNMNHARQRTDRIHGTIYLSALESELSSTPFFYRLHDIYQSSTVYLTFPSNRTKRYEHSLGTMVLASELLFSSITNSDVKVRKAFFNQLDLEFKSLYKKTFTKGYDTQYFGDGVNVFNSFVTNSKYGAIAENKDPSALGKKIDADIKEVISAGLLSDDALNHYSLHNTKRDIGKDISDSTYLITADRERFIYQCILQAVRIVALFHDVGHPPYSHIIESTLENLYNKAPNTWNPEKGEKLKDTLGRFLDKDNPYTFHFINTERSSASPHLHERVGIYMFRMAVEFVMPTLLDLLNKTTGANWSIKNKMIVTLYYITVVEFAAAILLEKDNLFRSIHRIVDGVVDADRLDYVVRDSLGSGVDWGTIPYKRIIDSAKLFQINSDGTIDETGKSNLFVISYPQKVSSDIEDFLMERYKIFARINYHHRCMKTAVALQSAVNILAEDYLRSPSTLLPAITEPTLKCIDDELCQALKLEDPDDPNGWQKSFPIIINHNIHNLWTALGTTSGDESLKVLQWNDSWLLSTLQSALLKIRTEENFETKYVLQAIRKEWKEMCDSLDWKARSIDEKKLHIEGLMSKKREELSELCKNLEEFLLNKKVYYSLLKRGIDAKYFIDDVIKYAGLSIPNIEQQMDREMQKYYDVTKTNPNISRLPLYKCLDESDEDADMSPGSALEAIKRLDRFLKAAKVGDLKLITSIFPPDGLCAKDIIGSVLHAAIENHQIVDYKMYVNDGREKMGLPPHNGDYTREIYLYNNQQLFMYDEISLKPQLKAIEQSIPWLYIYVIPPRDCVDTSALLTSLRNNCAEELGKRIRTRFDELFPHHQ